MPKQRFAYESNKKTGGLQKETPCFVALATIKALPPPCAKRNKGEVAVASPAMRRPEGVEY